MTTNKKLVYGIIIGIFLIVAVIGITDALIIQYYQKNTININQTPLTSKLEIICGTSDPIACQSDADCMCTQDAGCFVGNKNYYEKCIDKTSTCEDVCVGWGQPPVKCINRRCSNSYNFEDDVTISTDKTEYGVGEAVKIEVVNNSDRSVWDFASCGGSPFWRLQKIQESGWGDVDFFLPYFNREKEECSPVMCEMPVPQELKAGLSNSSEWRITSFCDYDNRGDVGIKPVKKGIYRITFSYGFSQNNDRENEIYSNEFTIKDKVISNNNCGSYKYPMTDQQRNECIYSDGYKKFNCMGGAYCATDSQKPCKTRTNCPSGEICQSENGSNWYCSGRGCGCYHNDPQNPEVIICVD